MQQMMLFENEEFGQVRMVEVEGKPYFVGKDVAYILGYKDTSDALKRHVDEDDKLSRCFSDSGQSREMYIINESGLYSLILSSKLPTAKAFKRWVTSEVLPSIRQTGNYISETSQYSIKEIVRETICQVVPAIIQELEEREEREKLAEMEMERLELKVRRKIERLLYSGKHTYLGISKILAADGFEVSPAVICFYAESMGILD